MNQTTTLSILDLNAMKQQGEKISCLTAYDASFTSIMDQVGIDIILVGDSLGMVIQGQASTVPVTLEAMLYHSRWVSAARKRAFVMADLPFLSYSTASKAIDTAAVLMQQGGVQMVKLEGARIEVIQFLVNQGVPVCGHLGLLPQSINQLGKYKVQGKQPQVAAKILADAKKIEQSGAGLLVLECVPAALAKIISSALKIPVIGIGAGFDCDGQVLVLYDMLGLNTKYMPKFTKNFMQNSNSIEAAIEGYHDAVKQQLFPCAKHSY